MNSNDKLLSLFESCPVHELDSNYYRLKILSKNDAIDYTKNIGLCLLKEKNTYPIEIVKDNRLVALAIAISRKEDSDIFKKRIGSIEWLTICRSLSFLEKRDIISQLLQKCHNIWCNSFDVVTALIDFDQYDFLETLQESGAKVYGGNYTWTCSMSKINETIFSTKSLETVVFFQQKEVPKLIECVNQSYSTYHSHYHADSRFNNILSSEVYLSYIKKHLESNGEIVVAKNIEEEIIGFSTINPHQEINEYFGKNLVAEVAYSGVSPSARGGRTYELTLIRSLELFKKQGFSNIIFGCSANNYVVQSIWIKLGDFRPRRFCYRFHWWL